jgi:hypothetical protein
MRALVIVLALFLAPAATMNAIASPQSEVRALLLHQSRLFKQQRWRALYATLTPRLRARCPYARFVRTQRQNHAILGSNFQLRDIRVRIETRTRAIAAYSFVKNGQVIVRVTFRVRDVYVKSGSRWLDEYDRVSGC